MFLGNKKCRIYVVLWRFANAYVKLYYERTDKSLNIERIKAELSKTYARIEQLQKRARDLEEQKKQAEDMEYLKIIRKHGISAEELQLMIDISNEEQKQILENREKEQTGNEENP